MVCPDGESESKVDGESLQISDGSCDGEEENIFSTEG